MTLLGCHTRFLREIPYCVTCLGAHLMMGADLRFPCGRISLKFCDNIITIPLDDSSLNQLIRRNIFEDIKLNVDNSALPQWLQVIQWRSN